MISKKHIYKEKVVEIYEKFFQGVDITESNESFWDGFFLLKVSVNALMELFGKHSLEELMCLKPQLNRLCQKCTETLHCGHFYRVANAAQTLCCCVSAVFRAGSGVLGRTPALLELLLGFKSDVDMAVQSMLLACHSLVTNTAAPVRLKAVLINLLLTLATANNVLNENVLVEYLLTNEILEVMMTVISDYTFRSLLGKDVLFLLTVLMQYQRYNNNYCRMKMAILEEQIILNGISHLISLMYVEFINKRSSILQTNKGGVIFSLTSAIGSFLVKSDTPNGDKSVKMTESCFLLTLFDFLQLNSHFSYIITSPHSVFQCPTVTDNQGHSLPGPISNSDRLLDQPITDLGSVCEDPTNIIAVFLEYCSIVMQDIREVSSYNNCRMCFLIMLSLAEDQTTATTLHDTHLAFKVTVHRKKMRHRNFVSDDSSSSPRPLVCAIVDVIEEFILCHIMKAFPTDLFNIALDVLHRLVCFQKNRKLRIRYDWKPLWNSLITLTKYLVNNFNDLPPSCDVLKLLDKVEVIFNIFITFGDTFLHCPTVYDDLYYEIIRMASVFENLHNFIIRGSVTKLDSKEDVAVALDHLINIRAIIQHFAPKIQSWSEENRITSMSREQILEIVSANYDSLTLKLHRNLDKFEPYTESCQKERAFFHNLTRSVVVDIQERCLGRTADLQQDIRKILLPRSSVQDSTE